MWFRRREAEPPKPAEAELTSPAAGDPSELPGGPSPELAGVAPPESATSTEPVRDPSPPMAEAAGPEASDGTPRKSWWARAWDALNKPVFDKDEAWAIKTRERLSETRKFLVNRVQVLVLGRGRIDDELLEELEEILIGSDVGVATTDDILAHLRVLAREQALLPEGIPGALAQFLEQRLGDAQPLRIAPDSLNVLMVVGVNGVGKTTTVGKLAARLQRAGHPTVVAAADTFRAAAIDQLEVWAQRAEVEVVRHQHGGDAAAVVFDAIKAAEARGKRVLLIDTAGRLHNKANLMEELRKVRRIIDRELPGAVVQVLLVLDATTGQNGLRQAEVFKEAVGLTGVILTKLDGTAKGGVVFAIQQALGIPVQIVGVGEKLEDLGDFDPKDFVRALFGSGAPAA
ncbi:MAG: signal recognition particle-docking protein FtsY [Candidatus Sericytochromatia bacterium]|nr:signal recognition particle-docking protein FtsY [Candidatus Sericytochromatia bacterium]